MIRRIFFVSVIILICGLVYRYIYAPPTRMLEWNMSCWLDASLQGLVQMPEIMQKLEEKEKIGAFENFDNTQAELLMQKELLNILRRLKKTKVDKVIKVIQGACKLKEPGLRRLYKTMDNGQLSEGYGPDGFFQEVWRVVFGEIFLDDDRIICLVQYNNSKYTKPEKLTVNHCLSSYLYAFLKGCASPPYIPLTMMNSNVKYELFCMFFISNFNPSHVSVLVKQEDASWWHFDDWPVNRREEINLKKDLGLHEHTDGIEYILNYSEKIKKPSGSDFYLGTEFIYRKVVSPLQKNLKQLKQRLVSLKNKLSILKQRLDKLRNELNKN